jgi:hypothetical protein
MPLETGKAWFCVCVLLFASYNGRKEKRRLLQCHGSCLVENVVEQG